MATGVIKKYFDERGFGFLKPDDGGGDVFFHAKNLAVPWEPQERARVEYEIGHDPASGRTRAENVRPV